MTFKNTKTPTLMSTDHQNQSMHMCELSQGLDDLIMKVHV